MYFLLEVGILKLNLWDTHSIQRNSMAASGNTNIGVDKIVGSLKPILDALADKIKGYITTDISNIVITQNDLAARLTNIEGILAKQQKDIEKLSSKSTSRSKAAATHSETGTASDPTQTNVNPLSITDVIIHNPSAKFPNRMNWFKERYGADEQFRKDYTSQEIHDAMEKDATIIARKKNNPDGSKGKAELGVRAQFCWNVIKKDKAIMDKFEVTYQEAKKKAEDSVPPTIVQHETVETGSPRQ